MTKYYVIYKIKNGDPQEAYMINNMDNDLTYHLETEGDAHTTYKEFKDEDEAYDEMVSYNRVLRKEGD
jgi:hypothetical protein